MQLRDSLAIEVGKSIQDPSQSEVYKQNIFSHGQPIQEHWIEHILCSFRVLYAEG
jgi:hypothetical protein